MRKARYVVARPMDALVPLAYNNLALEGQLVFLPLGQYISYFGTYGKSA